ncbi:hypothetical protein EON65_53045, partial [archaeon]
MCHRVNHCYRKCPATKTQRVTSSDESSECDFASRTPKECVVLDCVATSSLGKRSHQPNVGKCKSLRPCPSSDDSCISSRDWLLWQHAGEISSYQTAPPYT